MTMNVLLLSLTPIVPLLLAAGAVWLATRRYLMFALPGAALPAIAAALALPDLRINADWMLLGARFGLDEIGRVFLLFTGVLWLAAGCYANAYLHEADRRPSYAVFHLLAMSGNLGLIVAQDMGSFFLFFALMSFASYGLVVHNRDAEAMRAGRVYLTLVIIGEVILFVGLQRLAAATGSLGLPELTAAPGFWTCLLLFVGFGIKAGVLPLHVWLPLAHPAAPVPASAVLSGAMIKAGLIGWLRFLPTAHPESASWGEAIVWLGLAAAFFGAVIGFCQVNAKSVLAYSSISQMGLMTAAFGLCFSPAQDRRALVAMIGLFAAHHALAKGALFLSVGIMAHPPRLPRWLVVGAVLAPALALVGAPWTSGALAKGMLKAAGQSVGGWKILLGLSGVGTTLLMLRFLYLGRRLSADDHHAPAGPGQWLPWLLLTALVVIFPLLPLGIPIAPATGIGSKLWPVLVGLAIGSVLLSRLPVGRPPIVPGDVLFGMTSLIEFAQLRWRQAGRFLRLFWVTYRWSRRRWLRRLTQLWQPTGGSQD